jgi:predicted dehydrogenase
MKDKCLRVGLLGAGSWAQRAHLPAFKRCKNARVVAICDRDSKRGREAAKRFRIPDVYTDHHELIERTDIDMIDIVTSASAHYALACEAIEVGKPILCEKPLATTYQKARLLAQHADIKKVKTKMGFTFRHSPAIRYMKELIEAGFVGDIYHVNGFEQNSQFINPITPFRWNPGENPEIIMPGSLEEYASHLIDVALWLIGDLKSVRGHMQNHIAVRRIRDLGNKMMTINIEDGCIFLGEFVNGAQATFQSSFIAIGGYPGLELRVFGSKGALVARLVEEFGGTESLKAATPDKVDFTPLKIPSQLFPSKFSQDESWINLYFGDLVQSFVNDIIAGRDSDDGFKAGAKSQEVQEAVFRSHLEKRWVSLPLAS